MRHDHQQRVLVQLVVEQHWHWLLWSAGYRVHHAQASRLHHVVVVVGAGSRLGTYAYLYLDHHRGSYLDG